MGNIIKEVVKIEKKNVSFIPELPIMVLQVSDHSPHCEMGKVEAFNLLLQMDESETSKIQQMLFKYMQLDQIDRAEVRGYIIGQIDQLLSSEKYSVKKGLKNA